MPFSGRLPVRARDPATLASVAKPSLPPSYLDNQATSVPLLHSPMTLSLRTSQKGGALIDDTRRLVEAWNPSLDSE